MASIFEWVVKRVVRELDHNGELIPMDSLQNSASFQPYCLLSKKSSSSWFWRRRYVCVGLFIRDILEPSDPEPAVECVSPIHFQDTVDSNKQVSVKVMAPGQGKLAFGAAVSGSSSASLNVCTLRVSPNTWDTMLRERHLRQPEHKVLQQLRNRGDDVFMVTEVLQTQEAVEVTQTRKQEGSGQLALPRAIGSQVEGQGHMNRKKTVTIPSGSILAFRVAQLVITGSDLNIHGILNKKQRTFVTFQAESKLPGGAGDQRRLSSGFSMIKSIYDHFKIQSDGLTEDSLVLTEDFQGLQMEVNACAETLENFSKTLCGQLLGVLGQVLRDQQALQVLQALEESLEQGQQLGRVEPLSGPAGAILECLVLPCRTVVKELAGPIFYLLEALAALSETQHVLLAQMLEARSLLKPLKLVEGLLEQSVPWEERRAVSLLPELLGSSWGSEAPTWGLLEGCGLELQVDAPQVCWEPEAQGCTCALYACLALLLKLSQLC
ncbi:gasdermin-D [Hipposideros larvatus]